MTIEVTQEDIDSGTRHSCGNCPIALAINRAAGITDSAVGITTATVRGVLWTMAIEASAFIARFDCSGPKMVEPFTFEMEQLAQ